jgi:hypothetical protein
MSLSTWEIFDGRMRPRRPNMKTVSPLAGSHTEKGPSINIK